MGTKQRIFLSALGSGILAFGLYHIHSISGVTEGGVLGLSLLLHHWFQISPAISGAIFNGICYLLGIRTLGKDFLLYSALSTLCYSSFYRVFEQFPPLWPSLAQLPLLASLLGAVFVGVGVGLCVRAGGAPTGDDALAMSLHHLLGCGLETVYLFSDLTVLLMSLSYIPLNRILYSLLTVVLSGQIIGLLQRIHPNQKAA